MSLTQLHRLTAPNVMPVNVPGRRLPDIDICKRSGCSLFINLTNEMIKLHFKDINYNGNAKYVCQCHSALAGYKANKWQASSTTLPLPILEETMYCVTSSDVHCDVLNQ